MADLWADLSSEVQTAVVAGAVSLIVAIVTHLIGPLLSHRLQNRATQRRIELEHRFAVRKGLRSEVGRHLGELIETGEALERRYAYFPANLQEPWLSMPEDYYGRFGYYACSFAYRICAYLSVIADFRSRAIYFDPTEAEGRDLDLMRAAALNLSVMSDTSLFDSLEYDKEEARDHFFADELNALCLQMRDGERVIGYREFQRRIAERDHPYIDIFRFIDDILPDESRLRIDRLICAHLVLIATLSRFGYGQHKADRARYYEVAHRVPHQRILSNLSKMIDRAGLSDSPGFSTLQASCRINGGG